CATHLGSLILCLGVSMTGACDDQGQGLAADARELQSVCVASGAQAPAGAWLCPGPLTLQCAAAPLPVIYVSDPQNPSCAPAPLLTDPISMTTLGAQPVRVRRANGDLVCETTVSVVDSAPPVLTPKVQNIWPPNHKFHSFGVEDCIGVVDACDPALHAEFIWASSDEPIDDLGDGHFAPDIMFDGCDRVQVRAERQGPKDGRVYKLGVRVVDRAGNVAESACSIIVDHDQRGVQGADSGESYRVMLDGQNGLPRCDGLPTSLPPVTVGHPVVDAGAPQTPPMLGI
ncbi:MAG: hypothetical protein JWN04_4369, partial [Myxococcaceae bacterium]|nr:hypothetical protein [Myxococcaceae bacterium]